MFCREQDNRLCQRLQREVGDRYRESLTRADDAGPDHEQEDGGSLPKAEGAKRRWPIYESSWVDGGRSRRPRPKADGREDRRPPRALRPSEARVERVAPEGRGAKQRWPSDESSWVDGGRLSKTEAEGRRSRRPTPSEGTKTERSEGLVPEEGVEPTRRVTGGRF